MWIQMCKSCKTRPAPTSAGLCLVCAKSDDTLYPGGGPPRNKDCPCGSGRKYKKCCLPIQDHVKLAAALGARCRGADWFVSCGVDREGVVLTVTDEPLARSALVFLYGTSGTDGGVPVKVEVRE